MICLDWRKIYVCLMAAMLSVASHSLSDAQQAAAPPAANGPTIEATTKFIAEKLASVPALTYTEHTRHPAGGHYDTPNMQSVYYGPSFVANPAACSVDNIIGGKQQTLVDFKQVKRISIETVAQYDATEIFSSDLAAGWNFSTSPQIYVVLVDTTKGKIPLAFLDEELATRVSKAIQHGVDLCGATSVEPF